MSEIKSVAIAGASGTLGPHVLQALLSAGFKVTVLTRSKKPGVSFPNVNMVEVDFTSIDSLTAALTGIDGVVSTVGTEAIAHQTTLIDAAVAAGVKRFIPSEYGTCTTSPNVVDIPIYMPVIKVREYLQAKAAETGTLTWTILASGAFREFLLDSTGLLDWENHRAVLLDKGDNRVSTSSTPTVGKAIAGIFLNFEATKNRVVRISEAIVTQNMLLGIARELKPEVTWEVTEEKTSALLEDGLAELRAGGFSMPTFKKILNGTAFAGEHYGAAYDRTDNKLLGIEELREEQQRELVAGKLI